jgi:hypothetical protein
MILVAINVIILFYNKLPQHIEKKFRIKYTLVRYE